MRFQQAMISATRLAVLAAAVAAGGLLLFAPAGANAALITLSTAADGQITDFPVGGSFDLVSDPNFNWTISHRSFPSGGVEDRALLEFDVSSLSGATINSATLKFLVSGTAGDSPGFQVHGYAGDGVITVADGNVGTTLLSPTSFGVGGSVGSRTLDVTAFVGDLVDADVGFAGFSFIQPSIVDNVSATIASSTQPNPLNRPALVIDYTPAANSSVPEPTSILLFGFGGIGMTLGAARRRREHRA